MKNITTNQTIHFTIKPNFKTPGSIIEKSTQGLVKPFVPNDSIRDLLKFNRTTLYEEYNLSPNPVVTLSFGNIFLECNIAQGMIFKGKTSRIIPKNTVDVNPGYKYIKKLRGGVLWYMMESKDIV